MPTKQVTIELTEATYALLAVLSPTGNVADVLGTLADHAADGLSRPGAWERDWVSRVPWEVEDWEELLTVDPEAEWRRIPRAGR
jgi:hypothetical protein